MFPSFVRRRLLRLRCEFGSSCVFLPFGSWSSYPLMADTSWGKKLAYFLNICKLFKLFLNPNPFVLRVGKNRFSLMEFFLPLS